MRGGESADHLANPAERPHHPQLAALRGEDSRHLRRGPPFTASAQFFKNLPEGLRCRPYIPYIKNSHNRETPCFSVPRYQGGQSGLVHSTTSPRRPRPLGTRHLHHRRAARKPMKLMKSPLIHISGLLRRLESAVLCAVGVEGLQLLHRRVRPRRRHRAHLRGTGALRATLQRDLPRLQMYSSVRTEIFLLGKPHNPMVNSGAIIVTSLIKNKWTMADRFDYVRWSCELNNFQVLTQYRKIAGGEYVGFNNATYVKFSE